MTRQAGVTQEERDANGCSEIPKRLRWIFVHDGDPVVIDEQEVKASCFFRDHVMGKLECRQLDPYAMESSADLTTTIDRLRVLRDRKIARIAEINARSEKDLAHEWIRLRLETEVRFCNDQIVKISRGLSIDPEPHAIAKLAWATRERAQRSDALMQIVDDLREVQAAIAKFYRETQEPFEISEQLGDLQAVPPRSPPAKEVDRRCDRLALDADP